MKCVIVLHLPSIKWCVCFMPGIHLSSSDFIEYDTFKDLDFFLVKF